MNRRKKIKQILTKKAKKANEKNLPKNKPRYISKAEREALENETSGNEQVNSAAPTTEDTTPEN